jgi:hypothetical protein
MAMTVKEKQYEDQVALARILELLGLAENEAEMIHWEPWREVLLRSLARTKGVCYTRQVKPAPSRAPRSRRPMPRS